MCPRNKKVKCALTFENVIFILALNQSSKRLNPMYLSFLSCLFSLGCSAVLSDGRNVYSNNTANCVCCEVRFTVDAKLFSTNIEHSIVS